MHLIPTPPESRPSRNKLDSEPGVDRTRTPLQNQGMDALSNKTALVSGASRGLGRAIAIEFARAGARVALFARSASGLAETESEISSLGVPVRVFEGDISRPDHVQMAVEGLEDWGLDILINNAGIIDPLGAFSDVSFDDWVQNQRVNVEGTARLTHAAWPLLRASGQSTIVTISSGAAVSNIAGWSAYCTAKAALDRLSMVLDEEGKPFGIRVFSFAPGTIETNMQKAIRSSQVGPSRLVAGEVEHLAAEIPARAVVRLCRPEAAELAGKHLDIRYPELAPALGIDT